MTNDYWTECAAGARCKRLRVGRSMRVKKAPNREVDGAYYHPECVPAGRSVTDPRDPRVPGYGEPRKYTRRPWET